MLLKTIEEEKRMLAHIETFFRQMITLFMRIRCYLDWNFPLK